MNKPFILGITGGSASGKSLFLKKLMEQFSTDQICLISQDNYYRPINEQKKDENGVENFDIPTSIDDKLFVAHLQALMAGQKVQIQEYTFNNATAEPKIITFEPRPIIVVEGIFVFHFEAIAKQIDLKVFIDAKDKIKLNRRIQRDNVERGYDMNDVMYRWKNHVTPTYNTYIKPHKKHVDLVIPNNINFQKGLDVLCAFLKTKLL